METNTTLSTKNITFPTKALTFGVGVGIISSLLNILVLFIEMDELPIDTISMVAGMISSVAEAVFISLIAYKIKEEDLTKPSFILLFSYATLTVLCEIVSFGSEEMGFILEVINIILMIVVGFALVKEKITRKIGIGMLLTVVSAIIMISFIDDIANSEKFLMRILLLTFIAPVIYFYESCKDFLSNKNNIVSE